MSFRIFFIALWCTVLLCGCACDRLTILNENEICVTQIADLRNKGLKVSLALLQPGTFWKTNENGQVELGNRYGQGMFPCRKKFLLALAQSLRRLGGFEAYLIDADDHADDADVRIEIVQCAENDWQGVSSVIAFPGCFVFAPLWSGFAYDLNWQFKVRFQSSCLDMSSEELNLTCAMDVRYIDGGAATICSLWFSPPFFFIAPMFIASPASRTHADDIVYLRHKVLDGEVLERLYVDKMAKEIVRWVNATDWKGARNREKEMP